MYGCESWPSQVVLVVKIPSARHETGIQPLGREHPLEEEMATHSSILAWRIPTDGEARWATVHGVEKSQTQLND